MCLTVGLTSGLTIEHSNVSPIHLDLKYDVDDTMGTTYLSTFSLDLSATAVIMCADADSPATDFRNYGRFVTFKMFLVNKNTIDARIELRDA